MLSLNKISYFYMKKNTINKNILINLYQKINNLIILNIFKIDNYVKSSIKYKI